MKVYFAPSGIGLGHVGRCLPIAEELERLGIESFFSTYGQGVAYLKQTGFRTELAAPIGFAVRRDGTVDLKWSLVSPGPRLIPMLLNQLVREIRLIRVHHPDIVVSDTRITPIIAACLLGIPSIAILNQYSIVIPRKQFLNLARIVDGFSLTVIGWIWNLADHIIITDFPEPYTLSTVNLRIPPSRLGNVKMVGPMIPVRPEDLEKREELRKSFGVEDDRKIVFAPISGPVGEKRHLIDVLSEILSRFPEEYAVFMSTGVPDGNSRPTRKGNLTMIPWLKNRFELIKASDLIISRAGHGTLSQAMYFGKPTVVIPTPSHPEQFGNALRASSLGFAKILKQDDLTFDNLLRYVDDLSDSEDRSRKVEKMRSEVAKLNGINSILKIILDAKDKTSPCSDR